MGPIQIIFALLLLVLCLGLAVMTIHPLHSWLESPPADDDDYDQE